MIEGISFYNVLILYNEDFYKEIDLDGFESETVLIGNNENCNIKLNINSDDSMTVEFIKKNNGWQICDGENTYCVINGVKVPRRMISNGDKIIIKNSNSKEEIFKINYFIDFIVEKENYDRIVSLEKAKNIKIGSDKANNIIISDEAIEKKHAEIIKENNIYYLVDLKSKFGIYLNGKKVEGKIALKENDFIIICGYKFLFRNDSIAMSKLNEKIKIRKLEELEDKYNYSLLEYPCFYRSPRLLQDVPKETIVIEDPPQKIENPSNNIIITLIPLIGTILITLSMSVNKDSGSMAPTIAIAALTGAVTILTYVMQVVKTKKKQFKRYKVYKEYVKDREKLIIEKREILIESIKQMNPDSEECINFLEEFNRRLWERIPEHEDFLNVSLGIGEDDISFEIQVPDDTLQIDKDKLKEDPRKLKDVYGKLDNVPIRLNLLHDFPIGIYGNRPYAIELIKNMLIKIATLHYYEDVKIAIIHPKGEEEEWEWVKWLPHVWSNKKEIRYVANSKESAHNVLNSLYDEIKVRKNDEDSFEDVKHSPHYIIILADHKLVENEPIMSMLESDKSYGATGIFMYDHIGLIPKECKKLIEVTDNNNVSFISTENSNITKKMIFNNIDNEQCINFSRKMSPIYVKNSFTQNSLTSYLTLFDLYNIESEEELQIINYWNTNKIYETMAVPLGIKAGDEIVYLNLHEKFHGPHGLVAGTTGSGKSEIVQTYIASLAINYHPYDVSIIIIDYKGGGMANQFRDLPHLVGTITNLDGNQINRALVSIKSELKRRQRIFGESNVNHIDSYIKLFKKGEVNEPIPHLIIIADEFAELKNDQPDFMDELVSAARIGRSLGVHLILATQKPAGVVNDQIWSNSKFKLCLKVQNAEDSNEMIKSPLAANIVEPGRAYFQVGNNEIFELFQSAWSGAKKHDNDDVNKKEIEISEVLIDGNRKLIYSSKNDNKNKDGKTQLDAVIEKIKNVSEKNQIPRLQGPWLPPLSDVMYLNDIVGDFDLQPWGSENNQINVVLGMLDNPEDQTQETLITNLSEVGHMLIVGSSGSGKTTLVQTIITAIITQYKPNMANIYILDFGTRILKMYEQVPHVGGVITTDDDELIKNFIKFIHKEIARRKVLLSNQGVSTTLAYREATGEILPQIIIIIDNFSAFTELYEDYEDDITKFSRDGANLGISIIITAANSSAVRYKISSNFKFNIVLNCVDDGEYGNVLGRVNINPANNPGRGLVKPDKVCEFQTALPVRGETEAQRASNLKNLINYINSYWDGRPAMPIPQVPENLYIDEFVNNIQSTKENEIFIGLDTTEFENVSVNLEETSFLPILGKKSIEKSSCLKSIAHIIEKTLIKDPIELYVYDSSKYGLSGLEDLNYVKFYDNDVQNIITNLLDLKQEVDNRKDIISDAIISSKGKVKESEIINRFTRKIIVIDDIQEFFTNVEVEYDIIDLISEIVSKNNGYGITIVAAGDEEEFVNLGYNHSFMETVKNNNKGILLANLEYQNYFNVRMKYGEVEKNINLGDGYLINNDKYVRIKLPLIS